jgi:hypothetical protein
MQSSCQILAQAKSEPQRGMHNSGNIQNFTTDPSRLRAGDAVHLFEQTKTWIHKPVIR